MKKIIACVLLIGTPVLTHAQPVDPAFMQRAIAALQAQRNAAQDATVVAEAKAAGIADELVKAQTRIKELEAKKAEDK